MLYIALAILSLINILAWLWFVLMRRERSEVQQSQMYILGDGNERWANRSSTKRIWVLYFWTMCGLTLLSYVLSFWFYV